MFQKLRLCRVLHSLDLMFFILLFTAVFQWFVKRLWWLKRTWKLKGVFIVTPNAMIKLEVILYLKWFWNFYHRDSCPTFVSANFHHDFTLCIFKYIRLLLIRHLSNINPINEHISNKRVYIYTRSRLNSWIQLTYTLDISYPSIST